MNLPGSRQIGAVVGLLIAILSQPAMATISFYTSETAWQAAVSGTGSVTTFNFNSTPYLNYSTASGLTIDGVNLVGSTGAGGYSLNLTPAYFCCNDYNNPNVTLQAPAITSSFYGETNGLTTITLPNGTTAFALDAYSVQAGDYSGSGHDTLNLTVNGVTGTTQTQAGSITGFIGFVSTAPVGKAVLQGTTRDDFIDLTDGAFVHATGGVPEISTWAMMLLGFAGLGLAGRRSSRRTAV